MATLLFLNSKLQGILTITQRADTFYNTYDKAVEAYERDKQKEYQYPEDLSPYHEHKTPCLYLVKDSGIYLIAAAKMDKNPADNSHICFAEGFEETAPDIYEKCVNAVGGNDFVELIEWTNELKEAIEKGANLRITISATSLQVDCLYSK
jgi:hypothetical protein